MNLLLINADQLRHDCLGHRGLRGVKTPHLDALAAQSTVYTRAFTPLPVCAPARQALLCGRNPDSFGAQWNYDFMPTPTAEPDWCWPKRLEAAGYQTAYLGRFHVSPARPPRDFGYQRHVSWAGHKELIQQKYPNAEHGGGWLGCTSPIPFEDSGTHWMAGRACEMIREFAAGGRPWHIWVDYEEPHLPCRPSEPFASMYDGQAIPPWDGFGDDFIGKPYCQRQQPLNWGTDQMTWADFEPMVRHYYGVVSQLDDAIGRILAALEAAGQAGDTIVAFTSDHGDLCGSHQMLDKHYVLYDDIVRVPLMVRFPGRAPWVCDSLVSNCLDLPASFARWLGIGPLEVEHGRPLPLSPEEDVSPREHIVSTGNGQQFGLYSTRMLRDGRYKYIWNLTDVDEFYDLAADPGELRNLIAEPAQQGRIASMRRALYDALLAQGDPFANSQWLQPQLLSGRKHVPAHASST